MVTWRLILIMLILIFWWPGFCLDCSARVCISTSSNTVRHLVRFHRPANHHGVDHDGEDHDGEVMVRFMMVTIMMVTIMIMRIMMTTIKTIIGYRYVVSIQYKHAAVLISDQSPILRDEVNFPCDHCLLWCELWRAEISQEFILGSCRKRLQVLLSRPSSVDKQKYLISLLDGESGRGCSRR